MKTNKYLLGFDVGSSSVKASLVDTENGACVASTHYPENEAPILSLHRGWAEQSPDDWWEYLKLALRKVMSEANATGEQICAIGISYQMHGLVCVDRDMKPLRNAIIWCDSRAVPYGEKAFEELGSDLCLSHLLNSPGNFTASKLAWVKENEHELFDKIEKIMLPGDYIALRLSGECNTTISGLSEGMLWDFQENRPAEFLMDYFGFPHSILPQIVPTFSIQSTVNSVAAAELNLKEGTPICYRAGDQPNNALSLNVFNPGEIAATAGTSGVVYGVLDHVSYDSKSRVNNFAHVNHQGTVASAASSSADETTRLGVLLCINGTGVQNAWMRRNVAPENFGYVEMNKLAATVPIGSEGLCVIPFGNGAERMLENREINASILGIDFLKHTKAHLLRAAQEGIVFSFCYGMEIMHEMGMQIQKVHAGNTNMFLSDIFRQTLATTSGTTIELMETDGSTGAAKGAGMGLGLYKDHNEAFASLKQFAVIEPDLAHRNEYLEAYAQWKEKLYKQINSITL